ncbi:MAG: bifunctional nicotinamidase/pyrazinamidase [Bacteroidota bacterium]
MNALILVDIQYDFIPGGALAVAKGDTIIPLVNQLIPHFELIVATQDWHPQYHESFASQHPGKQVGEVTDLYGLPQVLWPDHCIQKTKGAELVADLHQSTIQRVFPKGTDATIDSYSGFFDNGHRKATGMGDYLKEKGVERVFVVGLATDYCVKFTALDAQELGFETYVFADATRGVNLAPDDTQKALEEMTAKGIHVLSGSEWLNQRTQ